MENNIDDKELLGKVSSGSEEAFDYIYLRYSPVVTSYAEALLKDRHTADDICHNIFARLWEKRSSLSGIRSLKAYLFTATKNAVFDVWKQRLPEKESPSLPESMLEGIATDDLEGKIEATELMRLIDIAVSTMPQERRTVFRLSRINNMTNREVAEYLGISWMLERSEEKDKALEEEWERFAADTSLCRLDIRSLYGLSGIKKSRRRGVFVRYPYIAACAAAVVALLALQHIFFTGSTVSSTCLAAASEGKSGYNLPDGSYIWLNSGARLYYDDNLGVSGTRKVRLEGEAFFDVEKSGRPFVVDLDGKTRIKVLGTSFNVRNSDLWNEYEITLNSGRVQIISEGLKDIFLKPGQQCILSKDSSSAMVRNVDVSDVCSWTSDMLVFENSSLAEIALKLEHWYNTRIYFADGVDRDIRLSCGELTAGPRAWEPRPL